MVTSSERVQDEVTNDKLQQSWSPETGFTKSQSSQEGSNLSSLPNTSSSELEKRENSDPGVQPSQFDQEGTTPLVHEKSHENRDYTSESNKEKNSLSLVPVEVVDNLHQTQSSEIVIHALQSEHNRGIPSVFPEKVPEDGYNWRKYGQKLVKGNEFTRSYYRCTHPNCSAKRQVERSHAGQIMDTIYLGKHEHPKPQTSSQLSVGMVMPIQAIGPDEHSLSTAEDAHGGTSYHIESPETPQVSSVTAKIEVAEGAVSESNGTRVKVDNTVNPESKRLKRGICSTPVDKLNGGPRIVVQTLSEVDIVNDGYRWRKYGQKFVKGSPNPRSYYRCSNAGCPVKKHVERAWDDPKVVLTTYEGHHDHGVPPVRTYTINKSGSDALDIDSDSKVQKL